MTPVRSKRGATHATYDLRKTACGRSCDGWVVEPDTAIECRSCIRVARDKGEDGWGN